MISSFLFLMLSSFQAQAWSPCPSDQVIGEGVVASRFPTVGLGCVVQVTPRSKPELRYREFWFDERGRMMVFASVPGENPDTATGTRTYFLFPRKQIPAFKLLANGDLSLQLPTGQEASFGGKDAGLVSFPGEFTVAAEINLDNNGGVELNSFKGLRLDAGWAVGTQSYKNPNGFSVLSDARNRQCLIMNEDFFFYENMYYGEPNLRYPDDASLKTFLQSHCPELDLSSL